MADALVIIDIDLFSDSLARKVATFRRNLKHIPAFWTNTGECLSGEFPSKYGFLGHDQMFYKPDVDASLQDVNDSNGLHILEALQNIETQRTYVIGATFYGCVLGAAIDLKSMNMAPTVITDLTDYSELIKSDHEEGVKDWLKADIPNFGHFHVYKLLGLKRGGLNSPKP